MQNLPWIIALAAVALLASMVTILVLRAQRRSEKLPPLPSEWALSPRPVFSTDERRVYRLLREALPHHVILAKLPLVRLCQSSESGDESYWYRLLGPIHVTFVICSANGRVLAAIDLGSERATQSRTQQIKRSVLAACRVRYLPCATDNLPSVAELQLLVPQSGLAARGPMQSAVHPQRQARTTHSAAARRPPRTALWQDSSQFHDSFFAPDNRTESLGNSEFGALSPQLRASRWPAPVPGPESNVAPLRDDGFARDDLGGVVVEEMGELSAAAVRH
jgi:hypothetical protein